MWRPLSTSIVGIASLTVMQRFELADHYQLDVGYQISQAVVYLKLGAEIVGSPHCVGVEKLNKIIHVKCKQCLGQREHSHTVSYYHKSYSCPISLCDSLLLWKVSSKNQNFFKACVLAGQISLLWKFGICWEWSSHCSLVPVFDMFNECLFCLLERFVFDI